MRSRLTSRGCTGSTAERSTGARIGVWRQAGLDPEVDAIVERSVQAMRAAGATVVEVTLDESAVFNDEVTAIFSEFKRDIAKYLRVTPGRHPATLAELIAFNQADPIELRFFGQDRFELAERAPSASDPVVVAARQRATSRARAIIDGALAAYDLDAVVAPTNGPAWLTTLGQGDAFTGPSSSRLPAVSGYPSITVPAGFDGELPIGSRSSVPASSDGDLLSLAYQLRAGDPRPPAAEAARHRRARLVPALGEAEEHDLGRVGDEGAVGRVPERHVDRRVAVARPAGPVVGEQPAGGARLEQVHGEVGARAEPVAVRLLGPSFSATAPGIMSHSTR